ASTLSGDCRGRRGGGGREAVVELAVAVVEVEAAVSAPVPGSAGPASPLPWPVRGQRSRPVAALGPGSEQAVCPLPGPVGGQRSRHRGEVEESPAGDRTGPRVAGGPARGPPWTRPGGKGNQRRPTGGRGTWGTPQGLGSEV